jgi:hypothetical protein
MGWEMILIIHRSLASLKRIWTDVKLMRYPEHKMAEDTNHSNKQNSLKI